MKSLLYTMLLFTLVYSSCYLRTIQTCLQDEKCQLVREQCQNRPNKCQDIDATNPNNCSGIKCYYDYELKICQPFEEDQNTKSRRILDHKEGRSDQESESQHQDQYQYQQPNTPNQNEDGDQHNHNSQNNSNEFPNQPQFNQTTPTNTTQPLDPQTESNSTIIQPSTNSTSQNTSESDSGSFQMLQFNLNQDEILNSNLDEKDLVINTNFSYSLLATYILAKLLI